MTYTADTLNQYTSVVASTNLLTVTGYVEPGPRSNKWYASTAATKGKTSAVSQQDGTFAIPNVPVTPGTNSLTVTVTDVSGNVATQIVNFTVGTTVSYDANGNQTSSGAWTMTYDRENRLIAASNQQSAVSYQYDALGRQIRRTTYGSVADSRPLIADRFLIYAGWQLIAEYDGAGSLQRKYVYGSGINEPVRVTQPSLLNPQHFYFHADGLGSVTEMTDPGGLIAESYRYDVYGAPTMYNAAGTVITGSAIGNRLLFTGRDRDQDTTWYNYRHRYYNPTLGRFVQPDPIGILGGNVNLYTYCGNNPVNKVDPYGLSWKTWVAVGVVAALAVTVTVASGGTAAIAAGALVGAVINGGIGFATAPPGNRENAVFGGVVGGALGGGLAVVTGGAGGAIAGRFTSTATGQMLGQAVGEGAAWAAAGYTQARLTGCSEYRAGNAAALGFAGGFGGRVAQYGFEGLAIGLSSGMPTPEIANQFWRNLSPQLNWSSMIGAIASAGGATWDQILAAWERAVTP